MNNTRFRRLLLLVLILAGACGGERHQDFSAIDAHAEAAMQAHGLPGLSLCVARAGRLRFCRSYGVANVDTGRPVTEDTPFLLASITKTVTATAAMALVEEGRLRLEDRVADRVDFTFAHPDANAVTVRHLLTHTSAIADDYETMFAFYTQGADPVIPLEDAVGGYFTDGGAFFDVTKNFHHTPPGSTWAYSNMAFALLGRVIEIEVEEDFRDHVRRTILEPLGMTNSSLRLAHFPADTVAVPYEWTGTTWDTYGHYTFSDYPDGGLFASARDLVRFADAMADARRLSRIGVLGEAARGELLTRVLDDQALGFMYTELGGEEVYGHSGGEFGAYTHMFIRPRDGVSVAVVSNGSAPGVDDQAMTTLLEALFATQD